MPKKNGTHARVADKHEDEKQKKVEQVHSSSLYVYMCMCMSVHRKWSKSTAAVCGGVYVRLYVCHGPTGSGRNQQQPTPHVCVYVCMSACM